MFIAFSQCCGYGSRILIPLNPSDSDPSKFLDPDLDLDPSLKGQFFFVCLILVFIFFIMAICAQYCLLSKDMYIITRAQA